MIPVGLFDFYNGSDIEVPLGDPSFRVIFYICEKFSGKAIDTIEMRNPQFYTLDNLPLEKMIKGDPDFVPQLLNGRHLKGMVRRTSDWQGILESVIEECNVEDLVI